MCLEETCRKLGNIFQTKVYPGLLAVFPQTGKIGEKFQ